jgi:ankyrin repeat protein
LAIDNVDPNKPDVNGLTPLMAVAGQDHVDTLQALLENATVRTNMNAQDPNGKTALHFAVLAKLSLNVHLLLSCRADRNVKDRVGKLALDYALAMDGQVAIVQLLRS